MRGNEFGLQLDKATTSTSNKDAYLICYVRFIDNNDNIVEDLLFCKPILTNCSAHELFAILNNFFRKIISSGKIVLVYAPMVPELCLVVLAGCERYCRALPLTQNGPTASYNVRRWLRNSSVVTLMECLKLLSKP